MINQHTFVAQCFARYEEEGAHPGDGDIWDKAHYPLPKDIGNETIWLRHDDHQVQGLLQSEEMGQRCFFSGDAKWFLANGAFVDSWFDLWDLYDKWAGRAGLPADHGEKVSQGISANSTSTERSERAKKIWEPLSPEERSARGAQAWVNKTPEERSAVANRSAQTVRDTYTEEQSIERARKISRGKNPRPVIIATPDGEEIWYELIYDASKAHGIRSPEIGRLCAGKRKSYHGFRARYADE